MIASIATARETDFSTAELCKALLQSPRKKHVNELGIIFIIDGYSTAESFLINMLENSDSKMRFIAYCQLLRAENRLSEKSRGALLFFAFLPENQDIIDEAKNRLWLHLN